MLKKKSSTPNVPHKFADKKSFALINMRYSTKEKQTFAKKLESLLLKKVAKTMNANNFARIQN